MTDPRKALLVIDMQNDFITGALAVPGAVNLIKPIADYVRLAHARGWHVIYSRDWHPHSHCSYGINGGPWPIHCLQNSWGAEIPDPLRLALEDVDAVEILKGTYPEQEQYSAFTPELQNYIYENGINAFEVCGLAAEYCVKATVKDLVDNGRWVRKLNDLIGKLNDK
jgi:nicotinamidase/pyrazinamidase